MSVPDRLALIIATKDHPDELRRTLASVQAQSVMPAQVIVVDGGDRPMADVAREFAGLPMAYRRVRPPGLARQQNAGLRCVDPSVTLVGFLDDDIVLEPGALEAMLAFWRQAPAEVGGAGFNLLNNTRPPRAVWLKSLFCLDSARPGVVLRSSYQTRIGAMTETRTVEWLNSGTTVWRRSALEGRAFDEWFGGPGHLYDVDFSYGMSRRYRLMVVAEAGVREIPAAHRRWNDYAFGQWQVVNRLYFARKHPELSLGLCCWALVGHTLVNIARWPLDRDIRFLQRACGNLAGWVRAAPGLLAARVLGRQPKPEPPVTARTAEAFGYLWRRSADREAAPAYHFDRMQQALSLPPPRGLVLDAGCGEGIDLTNQARRPGVTVVGVELSEGGCRTSLARCRTLSRGFVVQGDVARLPFADDAFDFVYSYGVLHHLASPSAGLQELVRVLKPGGRVAVYVYERFEGRPLLWRWLLAAATACRRLTTQLPPALLYRLCQLGSPVIYALFTVPHRLLKRIPGCRSFAATIPFHHGSGPFSLVGDLYDRFSAPIEQRYTRAEALAFFQQAGLQELVAVNERGWLVTGIKGCGRPVAGPNAVEQVEAVGTMPGTAQVIHGP